MFVYCMLCSLDFEFTLNSFSAFFFHMCFSDSESDLGILIISDRLRLNSQLCQKQLKISVADPEGVCSNPTLRPNYFYFMGIFFFSENKCKSDKTNPPFFI